MLISLKILAVSSVIILIVGLIKPKWILFWMKQPDRLTVTMLSMLLFMVSWTFIAKLTLKPKEVGATQERPVDEQNELPLSNR